jgi:hypothetical protein
MSALARKMKPGEMMEPQMQTIYDLSNTIVDPGFWTTR